MWSCAEKVYPGLRFTRYGVLGDDVIIIEKSVAYEYARSLDELGVTISYPFVSPLALLEL